MITIIWTIPSISINEPSTISINPPPQQVTPLIKTIPRSLGSNGELPNETAGNNTNQGLAIEDNEKIYYSDGVALWSMNKKGTLKTKIIDEAYAMNIQILEDKIYYISQDTHGIYSVKKDGTQRKRLNEDKAYSINVYNRRIYFMDRYNKLYITSMSLDGKDKRVIKEIVANDMMIYNDYIYYITREGSIGKVRVDGANNKIIKKGVIQFDVSKTGIYYTYDPRKNDKPKGLYHLGFEKDEEIQLLGETPYSFNIYKNKVYYNHPSKLSLYSMLLDGTQKTEVTGTNTTQINIAGDYIFYKNLEDSKKIYRVNLDGTGRVSLQGKTLITNVTDLANEIDDLAGKEITPKLQRTYNRAQEVISKIIKPDMTDYKKTKIIHDYVVNHTQYDVDAAEQFLRGEDSDANAFMAYGVLINQKGVCQGYAEAMHILLSLAGVQSDLVIGDAMDAEGTYISHMWNMVLIDNEYYMLDATWDDPVGPRDILSHDFFLVDSETLKKTHRWAYDEYPVCNLNWSE